MDSVDFVLERFVTIGMENLITWQLDWLKARKYIMQSYTKVNVLNAFRAI